MTCFSARNFPADYGNVRFVGAGERTTYAPTSPNDYEYGTGFRVEKPGNLVSKSGEVRPLETGTQIWFTYPPKLYESEEIGVRRKGVWAGASLVGAFEEPDGYTLISKVQKPPGKKQSRVSHGAAAQKAVNEYVQQICEERSMNYEFVASAPPGSKIPDLTVKIDRIPQQFEIKGTSSISAPITLFDKSARRTGYPEFLDEIGKVYIENLPGVSEPMRAMNYSYDFIGILDYYQNEIDPAIGLAGDPGVIKSGKMPSDFKIEDPRILRDLRGFLIDHFAEGGDHYFAVHNRSDGEFRLFHTEHGDNLLAAEPIPDLRSFQLCTYGGASLGATRVGVRVKL